MWIRMEYTDNAGRDRAYTAWVNGSFEDWLIEKGIPRENIHRLWIGSERTGFIPATADGSEPQGRRNKK